MAKIYPQEALEISKKLPKKETIQFLLNYSNYYKTYFSFNFFFFKKT